MNASAAEPGARLGIVQGQSQRDRWELSSTAGPAMIVVGSSASCSWVVEGVGVAPLHFSLYWDGQTLRISRSPGAPELHVDGELVWHSWRVLGGPARIQFGEAAIIVETSTGAGATTTPSGPGPESPVTVSVGGSISSPPPERNDTGRDATRPDSTRPTPAPGRPSSDRPAPRSFVSASRAAAEDHAYPTKSTPPAAAPPEMRPIAAPISEHQGRPFPGQYLLVGVLTVGAYFAWLYLLDHF